MSMSVRPYLELLRPANVATAAADVLAGYAAAGAVATLAVGSSSPAAAVSGATVAPAGAVLGWLLVSTTALYAGGIVLNDYFDRALDARERPERPIPSGRVSPASAGLLGAVLLGAGVLAASRATGAAAWIAGLIAALCVLYDSWGKHQGIVGSLNMGACRAFNFLLGVAAVPAALSRRWPLAILSLVYIAAVTALSRGEVRGGRRRVAVWSFTTLGLVVGILLTLTMLGLAGRPAVDSLAALAFVGLLAWRVLPPFWRTLSDLQPAAIRHAVRSGVLSLVLLNAVLAAQYGGALYSVAVLATALVAQALARAFAVT